MTPARTALVTGGNRGIGRAIAQSLADSGHQVAVTYRDSPPKDATGLHPVRCDVTSAADIDDAFRRTEEELGTVEILVASAGIVHDRPLIGMTEDQFTAVLDTNLTGAYRCAARAAPRMLRGRWGRILFVGSVTGLTGNAGQANYAASKAGLVGMARSLAREFGRRGVTVNTLAPGLIDTDMTADLSPRHREELTAALPVPRIGTCDDLTAAALLLTGESAGYITGAVLPVDGGLSMGA
ncbi:3-oxoacyl-ACP reductase FabG [Streptomyces iconiensis]|uniref:3-oxoacyl-ACP reductase FabG n=1 Tax=Streptomyces iconiensis TaxID=1384038 RepID=A0ABT7A5F8_9ACTN|nr:3-oxoacyl-ACP reductase FabG [Streptomyces iconiensis]MDJ1136559.1 3-oxoacyl-ACP reductase FabG [Streptomyces iconiensis]